MSNIEQAKEAKGRGNAAFSKGDFETAIKEFTAAIELNPNDHVFYSNRSGSYASLHRYEEALADAEKCIATKPDWAKGYSRKGFAAVNMGNTDLAKESYEAGLKIDPNNAQCKQGLKDCEPKANANPMASLFGPSMWGKLQADPTTREYLKDPAFVNKMKMMQGNPNFMGSLGSDPQVSAAVGVILGLGSSGFSSMNPGGGMPGGMPPTADGDGDVPMRASPAPTKAPEPEPEEEEEVDLELLAEQRVRAEAVELKNKGNAHYKKKEFEQALTFYDQAIEKDPENLAFHLNKAAAYYEQKDTAQCIATCKQVIKDETSKKGYDYQLVAKAWHRLGNAHGRDGNFAEAVECQKTSLLEAPLPAAQIALKKLEAKRKAKEAKEYLSPEKSEEAKLRGNEHFKAGNWTGAIEEYSEALKRDPENYRVYSNRAACYSKLMDWQRGMEDCDKCLSIDPNFVKVYIRKGKIQHFLKQYHKALQTYDKGLALDPKNPELIQGKRLVMNSINQANADGKVDPERQREAMKDPEIQAILSDPTINKVLKDMSEDPVEGQRALKDPTIMAKIEKLIAAGIVQVGNR